MSLADKISTLNSRIAEAEAYYIRLRLRYQNGDPTISRSRIAQAYDHVQNLKIKKHGMLRPNY